MSKSNKFYVSIIVAAMFLTLLNISSARRNPDYALFDPLIDVCDLIQKYYVADTDDEELIAGAINGMLHQLDVHSEYIPPRDVDEFQKITSGSYEGIGIGIDTKDGFLMVISPFEDSPAYQAGVRAGDIILEVNDEETKGWSSTHAVQELTGVAGSSVTLKVLHRDETEEVITIIRREITVPTVKGWRHNGIDGDWDFMLDEQEKIGYIRLTQFTSEAVAEIDQVVTDLIERNLQALILDLRSNPGGLMSTATELVDRFIDKGVIVSTRGARSSAQVTRAGDENTYPRFHLVILIDQGSASAAEIVAGSLQDHNRAIIVGTRSWGKGSVQRVFKLPESDAALKITTDYYYLPKNRAVHRLPGADAWGVDPDIEQDLIDPGLNAAARKAKIDQLRQLSEELMARQESFSENPEGSPSTDPVSGDAQRNTELADRLLALDSQIAQAHKQCKGLLRSRPPLRGLADILSE